MRVKTAILFISIVGLCLFSSICLAGTYSGGDGTTENPYQISDVNDFLELSATSSDWSNYFILTADIDLSGLTYSHAAIAWDTHYDDGFQGIPFTGVFNGNEHIIRNFKNDVQWGSDYHGLFGRIEGSSAAINNLGLEDVYIKGKYGYQFYGGLCGENRLGSISNCYVTGRVGGSIYTGGLCGSNSGGQINNCYSTAIVTARIYTGGLCGYNGESGGISHCYSNASVSGGDYVGGLCGMNSSSTITNCYSMGSVTSESFSQYSSVYSGALCGYNREGIINNCHTNAMIHGEMYVGGLCGFNTYNSNIRDCYVSGVVSGEEGVGGLCGFNNENSSIHNCYTTGPVLGKINVGALCGDNRSNDIDNCFFYLFGGPHDSTGIVLDEFQMLDAESFDGFDFADNSADGTEDHWTLIEGHCPKLIWQTDDGPLVPNPPATTLAGSGHPDDPFQINNHADFTEVITNIALNCGHYSLMTDIDLSGEIFTTAVINRHFGGHFAGNGHVIRNITIDATDKGYLGLFSAISAPVSDLGIEDININLTMVHCCSDYIGGLCGNNLYAPISNCYVTGTVRGGRYHTGGLCGDNSGDISNSFTIGQVSGDGYDLGGLCGRNTGSISNCNTSNTVSGNLTHIGGLCGENFGYISNCNTMGVISGSNNVGGLCGFNSGTIDNSFSIRYVNGRDRVGGVCGSSGTQSIISKCYSKGTVEGEYYVGGICGHNHGSVTRSYSSSDISGSSFVGGLVGLNGENTVWELESTVENCYSTGLIIGEYIAGGLVGDNVYPASVTNSFWNEETSGITISDGGTGKTTAQMQTQGTFIGWDFTGETVYGMEDIWSICEGTNYPRLTWQIPAGDYLCPDGVAFEDFVFFAQHWLETDYGTVEGADLTGDGFVGIEDLLVVADYWLLSGCGDCDGRDLTGEGAVDLLDFGYLGLRWQQSEYGDCGGAELTGDGIVDVDDFMLFCKNWLVGVE